MKLTTMATLITPENYHIVSACLPAGFLLVPTANSIGAYLVVNELRIVGADKDGHPKLIIENKWLNEKDFDDGYTAKGEAEIFGFFEVDPIPN